MKKEGNRKERERVEVFFWFGIFFLKREEEKRKMFRVEVFFRNDFLSKSGENWMEDLSLIKSFYFSIFQFSNLKFVIYISKITFK